MESEMSLNMLESDVSLLDDSRLTPAFSSVPRHAIDFACVDTDIHKSQIN